MSSSPQPDEDNGMSTLDRTLLGASAGFALAFFLSIPLDPYPGLVGVKGAGVFLLAVIAWRMSLGRNGLLLALGLLASSAGDVFLGIDRVGLFVQGLGSFLVAHLLYIAVFVRVMPRPLIRSKGANTIAAIIVLYGVALGGWLFPALGGHTLPVLVYAAAITIMGVTSVFANFPRPWVVVGAALFILSDSAIAIDKFLMPIEGVGYFIWPTYYLGQLLIATGVIAALRRQASPATQGTT